MVTLKDTKLSILNSRKKRYRNALSVVEKLKKILVDKYHVSKIILIGSLSENHRFGFHSDIDLCVEGLSDKDYYRAVGEILVAADEFSVDIIRVEDVTLEMRDNIQKGKILYGKR